ncbi:MAG: alpha-galactosidase [Chloroflexota bacterium]
MNSARAQLAPLAGRPALTWADLATTGTLEARVRLADGSIHVADSWTPDGPGWRAPCGPLTVELAIELDGDLARLALAAEAIEDAVVTEIGVVLTPLIGAAGPNWVVYNGYQSWDASGVLAAGATTPADAPVKRQSWWTVGLAAEGGAGLAIAAVSAVAATTRFDWEGGRLVLTACEFPGLKQNPPLWKAARGGRWAADPVVITAALDVRQGLRRVAAQVPGLPPSAVPRGWLSWYHYGPWISASEVLENSEILSHDDLRSLGYEVILVDDGWQQAYGDWQPNSKFPGGLAALAVDLAARGQALGVWTAPFLVSAGSDLAARAPAEWFVADPTTGERAVDPVHVVFGPMYILDARHPDVLAHLESTFARLRADGVDYFKIDFLYAGAYAGTGAVRAGVEAIRRGAGDAAYLLACGAPLLPVVGLCEGCRIGRDSASPIFDFELGSPKPTLLGDEVVEVGRNQAARHFLDTWFQLDADVALVRGNLTLEQGRTLTTVAALSGGPFFASDHLAGLAPERLATLVNRDVLALVGSSAAVPDWLPADRDRPSPVWRRDGVVALFNWGATDREVTITLPGRRHARELWQGRDLGVVEGELTVSVPASDARLVALDEA